MEICIGRETDLLQYYMDKRDLSSSISLTQGKKRHVSVSLHSVQLHDPADTSVFHYDKKNIWPGPRIHRRFISRNKQKTAHLDPRRILSDRPIFSALSNLMSSVLGRFSVQD